MGTPPYRLLRADTADALAGLARVGTAFLAKRESSNNLQLAILDQVARGRYPGALLVGAEDAYGDLVALLLRTPPHPLLVPDGNDPAALALLLDWFAEHDAGLPGVVGPLPHARALAERWAERQGVSVRLALHEGVYRLRRVTDAARAAGTMRAATPDDRALVLPWLEAFEREAFGAPRSDPAQTWASFHHDASRTLVLWEDPAGTPVSLAGVPGRTPSGARIGPVYTPPPLRGRGYAEALVAAVCASVLAGGARHCFLYTDLGNPTSNALYERIGFTRIGEAAEYRFETPPG